MKINYKIEYTGFLLIGIGIILTFFFLFKGNFMHLDGVLDPEQLSRFGGFIGGTVGIIFSLAAYLLVYETFRLHKKQQFESMFFSLFNEFNNFRYNHFSIDHVDKDIPPGIKAFTFFIEDPDCLYLKNEESQINKERFKKIANRFSTQLNKFNSHLDMIIYLLDKQSELNKEEKEYYLQYILNQLTDHERLVVFYHRYIDGVSHKFLDSLNIPDPNKIVS